VRGKGQHGRLECQFIGTNVLIGDVITRYDKYPSKDVTESYPCGISGTEEEGIEIHGHVGYVGEDFGFQLGIGRDVFRCIAEYVVGMMDWGCDAC